MTYPEYDENFVNYTIPYLEDGKLDSCHHATRFNSSSRSTCFPDDFNMAALDTCENGSVFDQTVYGKTVVTEVCELHLTFFPSFPFY